MYLYCCYKQPVGTVLVIDIIEFMKQCLVLSCYPKLLLASGEN